MLPRRALISCFIAGTVLAPVASSAPWSVRQLVSQPALGPALLGNAAAISADGRLAVVGAPKTAVAGRAMQGVAVVFSRTGTTWNAVATLSRAAGAANDQLGMAVAISGDGTTIVAGSPDDPAGATGRGSVTFFTGSSGTWTEGATVRRAGAFAADEHFGRSVAMSADGTRVVVGTPYAGTALIAHPGAVTVLDRAAAGWGAQPSQVQLFAPSPQDAALFGEVVAISGDGAMVLGGGPSASSNRGMAAVYRQSGGTWLGTQVPPPAGTPTNAMFGGAIAASRTGGTVLISAWNQDTSGANGTVYAYDDLPSSVVPDQVLTRPGGGVAEFFGFSLGMDAAATQFVGGGYATTVGGVAFQGMLQAFSRPPRGAWTSQAAITAPTLPAQSWLGTSAAMSASGGVFVAGAEEATVDGLALAGQVLFATTLQPLTVAVSGPGAITGNGFGIACGTACSADVVQGDSVTLVATADAGAQFTGWGGACTGSDPTCVVSPSAATSVTAGFRAASAPAPAAPTLLRQKVRVRGRVVVTTGPATNTSVRIGQHAVLTVKKGRKAPTRRARCTIAGTGKKRAFACRVTLLPGQWTLTTRGTRSSTVVSQAVKKVRIR